MKQLAIAVFAVVMGAGLMVQEAEAAKRLGGGKSSGISRDSSMMKRDAIPAKPAAAPTAAAPAAGAPAAAAPAAAAQSGMSRWMGPLAGLAAGLGIAALLSHFGLGEAAANFLLIALLVFAAIFVVRLLLRKREPQPALQYAGAGAGNAAPADYTPARFESATVGAGATAAAAAIAANIPADFDVAGFLRQAKLNFIRLQAANDRGDMDDIRQFTAPELYAEIEMQFRERAGRSQETDVQQLDAEVLEVVTEGGNHIASVRFFGSLREDNAPAEAFTEVWHLTKPVDGSRGWAIAGIQQV